MGCRRYMFFALMSYVGHVLYQVSLKRMLEFQLIAVHCIWTSLRIRSITEWQRQRRMSLVQHNGAADTGISKSTAMENNFLT